MENASERDEKEKESLQLASVSPGGGNFPRLPAIWPPLLSLSPYLLSPRHRHPLSRFLSLTLFLSLPVCMVKYCIIVLTAGRKTAQPVVPARRVARIRAACTLLFRRVLDLLLVATVLRHRVASHLGSLLSPLLVNARREACSRSILSTLCDIFFPSARHSNI